MPINNKDEMARLHRDNPFLVDLPDHVVADINRAFDQLLDSERKQLETTIHNGMGSLPRWLRPIAWGAFR